MDEEAHLESGSGRRISASSSLVADCLSSITPPPPTAGALRDNVRQLSKTGLLKGTPALGRLAAGACELMGNKISFSVIDGPQDEQRQ